MVPGNSKLLTSIYQKNIMWSTHFNNWHLFYVLENTSQNSVNDISSLQCMLEEKNVHCLSSQGIIQVNKCMSVFYKFESFTRLM